MFHLGHAFAFGTSNENSTNWQPAVDKTAQMDVFFIIFVRRHIDNHDWWVKSTRIGVIFPIFLGDFFVGSSEAASFMSG